MSKFLVYWLIFVLTFMFFYMILPLQMVPSLFIALGMSVFFLITDRDSQI